MPYTIRNNAILTEYPQKITSHPATHTISFGDLHGNALKLIYLLISEGCIELSPDTYKKLVDIYKTTPTDYSAFTTLISEIKIKFPCPKIHFIGDMLSDRGVNDLLTLKVLEKIDAEGLPFDILLSNHDAEFLRQYAHGIDHEDYIGLYRGYDKSCGESLHALRRSIMIDKIITVEEIESLIQKHYLPKLKMLELDNNHELYSHTPILSYQITKLAVLLSVENDLINISTPIKLKTVIDKINEQLQKILKNKSDISLLLSIRCINDFLNDRYNDKINDLYNQSIIIKITGANGCQFSIINIHGHVGNSILNDNIINYCGDQLKLEFVNIDDAFGRPDSDYITSSYKTYIGVTNLEKLLTSHKGITLLNNDDSSIQLEFDGKYFYTNILYLKYLTWCFLNIGNLLNTLFNEKNITNTQSFPQSLTSNERGLIKEFINQHCILLNENALDNNLRRYFLDLYLNTYMYSDAINIVNTTDFLIKEISSKGSCDYRNQMDDKIKIIHPELYTTLKQAMLLTTNEHLMNALVDLDTTTKNILLTPAPNSEKILPDLTYFVEKLNQYITVKNIPLNVQITLPKDPSMSLSTTTHGLFQPSSPNNEVAAPSFISEKNRPQ